MTGCMICQPEWRWKYLWTLYGPVLDLKRQVYISLVKRLSCWRRPSLTLGSSDLLIHILSYGLDLLLETLPEPWSFHIWVCCKFCQMSSSLIFFTLLNQLPPAVLGTGATDQKQKELGKTEMKDRNSGSNSSSTPSMGSLIQLPLCHTKQNE